MEMIISNGSGILDPPFGVLRIKIMRADRIVWAGPLADFRSRGVGQVSIGTSYPYRSAPEGGAIALLRVDPATRYKTGDNIYIYIYIYVYTYSMLCMYIYCEQNSPFLRALAVQPSSRNCSPAPDSVL